MSSNTIHPGQILRLPERGGATPRQSVASSVVHTPYKIRPGDTLSEIAEKSHTSLTAIKRANPYVKANRLKVGQVINIPGAGVSPDAIKRPDVHIVRRGDSIWNIAQHYGLKVSRILNLNGLKRDAVIKPGQVLKLT